MERAGSSQHKDLQDSRANLCMKHQVTPRHCLFVGNLVCSDPLNRKVQHMTPEEVMVREREFQEAFKGPILHYGCSMGSYQWSYGRLLWPSR